MCAAAEGHAWANRQLQQAAGDAVFRGLCLATHVAGYVQSRHAVTAAADMQVTQAAANIIRLRPPSVYKGKGIRLAGTTPKTKPGKRK